MGYVHDYSRDRHAGRLAHRNEASISELRRRFIVPPAPGDDEVPVVCRFLDMKSDTGQNVEMVFNPGQPAPRQSWAKAARCSIVLSLLCAVLWIQSLMV